MSDSKTTGWTGLLILRGKHAINPVFTQILSDIAGQTLVYGNSRSGPFDFRELADTETSSHEALAHVSQKLPVEPFSLLIAGDKPVTYHVPARSTTVALWSQGSCSAGFNSMISALVQINREPVPEQTNYAALVKEKVFQPQGGKYAVCLGYFSKHPRLILATKQMQLYTWVVYYNDVYFYVWSVDPSFMDRVKALLDKVQQNDLFYAEVPLDNASLLVIHPLYWITKFNKVYSNLMQGPNRLTIVSYFRNYLLRQTHTDALTFEGL
jgi:hypothetical protein